MQDDVELLEAWRAGDRDAASALIRRHFSRVYQFFRSKLDVGADDLTQRTFMACVEARDSLRDEGSFRAFLLGIARKQLLFHLRTRGRHDARFKPQEVSAADMGTSPSGIALGREEQRLLLSALRSIPIDLQIAIELFYWEEMTAQDIGHVLEIPEGTVRSRLRRAREALKAKLEELSGSIALAESTIQDLAQWAQALKVEVGRDAPGGDT